MALQEATISGTITHPDGDPFRLEATVVAVAVNTTIKAPGDHRLLTSHSVFQSKVDGSLTVTLPKLPQAGVLPADARWRISFKPLTAASGREKTRTPPPPLEFQLIEDTTWDELVDVSGTPVSESLLALVEAAREATLENAERAEAARVGAEAVGVLADTQIAGRVNTPGSATAGALVASMADRSNPLGGAIHLAITDRAVVIDAREYGVFPGDATTALKDMAATLGLSSGAGIRGARIVCPPGEYILTDRVLWSRWSGIIEGAGLGNSPSYSTPGKATVFTWRGPSDRAMWRFYDYKHVTVRGIRFEGNNDTPPTHGIESYRDGAATSGTGAQLNIEDCHLGESAWTTQGTNKGRMKTGIGFTGTNGNNDQYLIRDTTVQGVEVGFDVVNPQSVWGQVENTAIGDATVAGIRTNASLTGVNVQFQGCAKDILNTSTAVVEIFGLWSENSGRIIECTNYGTVNVFGGQVLLQAPMVGGQWVHHDRACGGAGVGLYGVKVLNSTGGAWPKLYARAFGGNGAQSGRVFLVGCDLGTMSIGDLDVASTASNALEVMIQSSEMFIHRRLRNAETLTSEGWRMNGFAELAQAAADPAAPTTMDGVKGGRLFLRDNGVGKSQLCVRFATGAVQVVSTEP